MEASAKNKSDNVQNSRYDRCLDMAFVSF